MISNQYKAKIICTGLILGSLLTTLTACENAPTRREDLLVQHPEWDANTVKVIRSGKIFKGMTKEQVRAAWGRPCYTCQGTTSGIWGEAWEYTTQVVFFDTKGKVVRHTIKQ